MRNRARVYFLQFKECKVNELWVEKLSEHVKQIKAPVPDPESAEFALL